MQEPPAFEPEHNPSDYQSSSDPFASDKSQYIGDYSPEDINRWHQPEAKSKKKPLIRFILFLLGCVSLSISMILCYVTVDNHNHRTSLQLEKATRQAQALVKRLEVQFLKPAQTLVTNLQSQIEHNPQDPKRILQSYSKAPLDNLELLSFGVAYKPYAFDPNLRLYAPFWRKKSVTQTLVPFNFYDKEVNSNIQQPVATESTKTDTSLATQELSNNAESYSLLNAADYYDYTRPAQTDESYDSNWFTQGVQGEGGWQKPYWATILEEWVAEYSLPLYKLNQSTNTQEKVGIVYADFSLEEVRQILRSITFKDQTYGYLVTPDGILLSHPDRSMLGKPLTTAFAKANQDVGKIISQKVKEGENFVEEFHDETSGQTSLVIHQNVGQAHWSFGIVLPKDNIYALNDTNRKEIVISVFFLGCALLLLLAAFKYNEFNHDALPWALSILSSFCGLGLTLTILVLFWQSDLSEGEQRLFTVNETIASRPANMAKTPIIPTGILVDNIEFPTPRKAKIAGIVWQRLDPKFAAKKFTTEGLIWPDAQLGTTQQTLVREYRENNQVVRVWRFLVEVPLARNIARFPFDEAHIPIKIRPALDVSAQLVPDFKAYNILIPETKPGVSESLTLSYWDIHSSFFSIDRRDQNKFNGTNIADFNFNGEIIFNINLSRRSESTLISNFFPIFIGSIMMFVVLMIPSDRSSNMVYSTLSYGGTIFFVISIFHVGLRNSEGIDSFTYLESYYILQHLLVMLISLNGFFLMRGNSPRWLHYRSNLLAKVLYWPILSGVLAASTAIYFIYV